MFYDYRYWPIFFFIVMSFVLLFNAAVTFNTRSFQVASRRRDGRTIEGWGAIAIGVVMVLLSLFCLAAAWFTWHPPVWLDFR